MDNKNAAKEFPPFFYLIDIKKLFAIFKIMTQIMKTVQEIQTSHKPKQG